ncbi:MAG: D-glycerate dehydrogenase [candidate division NC10 bacterium]|nr:D-glycerate dehydrogenase [candidate division NC10 bacterium]
MKIFIAQPIQPVAVEILKKVAEVHFNPEGRPLSRKEFLKNIGDVEAVILPWHTDVMDREALGIAARLQVIGRHGVGYDNIDLEAATERGIYVTFTPVLAPTMADTTFALLMAAARLIPQADRFVKAGQWTLGGEWVPWKFLGLDLHHKTLGIIGCGRVGAGVARRARGFDMRILYHDEVERPDVEAETGAKKVALDELLREAEFVSVTCALNERTRGLLGARQFAMMKPTAVLVNTARGPVLDQAALAEALQSRRIAAAGLDVFVEEPIPPGDPLLGLENVVVLPHIGSATLENRCKMGVTVAEDVVSVLTGKQPTYLLNPRVREVRPLG